MSNPHACGAFLEAWCSDGMAFTWGHGGAGRLGHGTVGAAGAGLAICVPHIKSGHHRHMGHHRHTVCCFLLADQKVEAALC